MRWTSFIRVACSATMASIILLLGLGAWAIEPHSTEPAISPRTAIWIARAPFADGIVIGDSRVELGEPAGGPLFVGYSGGTLRALERVTTVLCYVSDAPVVVALGVNDSVPRILDLDASLRSLERIVEACLPSPVLLAEIWPIDQQLLGGRRYDSEAIERINGRMRELASRDGVDVLLAPELADHTVDGVHFTPEISRRYLDALAGALPAEK